MHGHKDHPIGNKHSLYMDSIINTWGSMSCFTTQQGPNRRTREEARKEGDWFKLYYTKMEWNASKRNGPFQRYGEHFVFYCFHEKIKIKKGRLFEN